MYTVAGATGRVGSVTATHLLDAGEPVRVIVRDPAKGAAWAARGAEVAIADLGDRAALAAALTGSRGAFLLLPFDLATTDFHGDTQRTAEAIAGAVADAQVPHVVALSSAGADLPAGTGPIQGLHLLEQLLAATPSVVTALRPGHFQEKVADVLDAARYDGVFPVFAGSADVARPMVATRDVGAVAAAALRDAPTASTVIDVEGPRATEREVAALLGDALGRRLEVVTIPREGWQGALVEAGLSAHIAEVLVGLYDADDRGLLTARGDRTVRGTTPIEHTIAALVDVATSTAAS